MEKPSIYSPGNVNSSQLEALVRIAEFGATFLQPTTRPSIQNQQLLSHAITAAKRSIHISDLESRFKLTHAQTSATNILQVCRDLTWETLARSLRTTCTQESIMAIHQQCLLSNADKTMHICSSLMTTETSFRILNLAIQSRQACYLVTAAELLQSIRRQKQVLLSIVPNAASLSLVAINSSKYNSHKSNYLPFDLANVADHMEQQAHQILTVETLSAKNLAALLMAFIEFKISSVMLPRTKTEDVALNISVMSQDVGRPQRVLLEETTIHGMRGSTDRPSLKRIVSSGRGYRAHRDTNQSIRRYGAPVSQKPVASCMMDHHQAVEVLRTKSLACIFTWLQYARTKRIFGDGEKLEPHDFLGFLTKQEALAIDLLSGCTEDYVRCVHWWLQGAPGMS